MKDALGREMADGGVLSRDPRAAAWECFIEAMEALRACEDAVKAVQGVAKTTALEEGALIVARLPGLLAQLKATRPAP